MHILMISYPGRLYDIKFIDDENLIVAQKNVGRLQIFATIQHMVEQYGEIDYIRMVCDNQKFGQKIYEDLKEFGYEVKWEGAGA